MEYTQKTPQGPRLTLEDIANDESIDHYNGSFYNNDDHSAYGHAQSSVSMAANYKTGKLTELNANTYGKHELELFIEGNTPQSLRGEVATESVHSNLYQRSNKEPKSNEHALVELVERQQEELQNLRNVVSLTERGMHRKGSIRFVSATENTEVIRVIQYIAATSTPSVFLKSRVSSLEADCIELNFEVKRVSESNAQLLIEMEYVKEVNIKMQEMIVMKDRQALGLQEAVTNLESALGDSSREKEWLGIEVERVLKEKEDVEGKLRSVVEKSVLMDKEISMRDEKLKYLEDQSYLVKRLEDETCDLKHKLVISELHSEQRYRAQRERIRDVEHDIEILTDHLRPLEQVQSDNVKLRHDLREKDEILKNHEELCRQLMRDRAHIIKKNREARCSDLIGFGREERKYRDLEDKYLLLKEAKEELEHKFEEAQRKKCELQTKYDVQNFKCSRLQVESEKILNKSSVESEKLRTTLKHLDVALKEKREWMQRSRDLSKELKEKVSILLGLKKKYGEIRKSFLEQRKRNVACKMTLRESNDRTKALNGYISSLNGQVKKQLYFVRHSRFMKKCYGEHIRRLKSSLNYTTSTKSNLLRKLYRMFHSMVALRRAVDQLRTKEIRVQRENDNLLYLLEEVCSDSDASVAEDMKFRPQEEQDSKQDESCLAPLN